MAVHHYAGNKIVPSEYVRDQKEVYEEKKLKLGE